MAARSALALGALSLLLLSSLSGCDTGGGAPLVAVASIEVLAAPSAATAGAELAELKLKALDAEGAPVDGARLKLSVEAGGGALAAATVQTGRDGLAAPGWTLGRAPITNRLRVQVGDVERTVELRAEVVTEVAPETFGDVEGWLSAEGLTASTEGLAFASTGELTIGIPGGLATVSASGDVAPRSLSGDSVALPLGLTYAPDGALWICDTDASALLKVSPEGEVTTVVTHDGDDDLVTPNDVRIGPDGAVYFTDSCLGRLYRVNPDSGAVTATLSFDLPTQGGPNGLAFDSEGALWLTTENTALLCQTEGVGLTDDLAGLYRVPLTAEGFDTPEAIAQGVALFGDGLTFDEEGNLYILFDTVKDFALDESVVYVLPRGEPELVRFFGIKGQVMANLAFGAGAYGDTTLYATLLAVPPFVTARGVVRVEVGVRGAPR